MNSARLEATAQLLELVEAEDEPFPPFERRLDALDESREARRTIRPTELTADAPDPPA